MRNCCHLGRSEREIPNRDLACSSPFISSNPFVRSTPPQTNQQSTTMLTKSDGWYIKTACASAACNSWQHKVMEFQYQRRKVSTKLLQHSLYLQSSFRYRATALRVLSWCGGRLWGLSWRTTICKWGLKESSYFLGNISNRESLWCIAVPFSFK